VSRLFIARGDRALRRRYRQIIITGTLSVARHMSKQQPDFRRSGHGFPVASGVAWTTMNPLTEIPGALQSATGAIHKSLRKLDQNAHVVANSTDVTSRDTVEALIDSRQQVLYTQAAAKIIRASDEMARSLIDIRA
jgi:hypothetical protein